MNKKREDLSDFIGCKIILHGIQVKSAEKARLLAKSLDVIEKECGIRQVDITIEDSFICPDIDGWCLGTPMERLLNDIFKQIWAEEVT